MLKLTLVVLLLLLVVVGLLLVFQRGGPTRALSRAQAVDVLEKALAGTLRDAEWLVFMGLPVRHDPVLLEVRLRCMEIERQHFVGEGSHRAPFLFRKAGLDEIALLLRWLHKEADSRLL